MPLISALGCRGRWISEIEFKTAKKLSYTQRDPVSQNKNNNKRMSQKPQNIFLLINSFKNLKIYHTTLQKESQSNILIRW